MEDKTRDFEPTRKQCGWKEAHTAHIWVDKDDIPYECVTVGVN